MVVVVVRVHNADESGNADENEDAGHDADADFDVAHGGGGVHVVASGTDVRGHVHEFED